MPSTCCSPRPAGSVRTVSSFSVVDSSPVRRRQPFVTKGWDSESRLDEDLRRGLPATIWFESRWGHALLTCRRQVRLVHSPSQRRRRSRGHIRELPSGSFQAIVYAGKDPLTGKERYERQTAKTYQAAEIALNAEGLIEVSRGRRALVRAGLPTPPG